MDDKKDGKEAKKLENELDKLIEEKEETEETNEEPELKPEEKETEEEEEEPEPEAMAPVDTGIEDIEELLEDRKTDQEPTPPKMVCLTCGKTSNETPLVVVGDKFFCGLHTPRTPLQKGLSKKQKKRAARRALKAAKPPEPWEHFKLLEVDALRKKVAGTNQLLQAMGSGINTEVQLRKGDRVVVLYIDKDGNKHKVLDKTQEEGMGSFSVLKFIFSSWGTSTLMPHMEKGRLTPPGYG